MSETRSRATIPVQRHSELKNAPRQKELIRLDNITVRYGRKVLLDRVQWTVREGESWALLGPNGSGKTTLLSLILGDNPQVYVNPVTVLGVRRGTGESLWDLKRKIGWVSPELHLHFDANATCFEVVASGFLATVGLFEPPTRRQWEESARRLREFKLEDFAQVPLFALSAGTQRLALIARAMVSRPKLLILDEPCQGLDGSHRQQVVAKIEELIASKAATMIYVTHRPEEIPASIKRVLRLSRGRATVQS